MSEAGGRTGRKRKKTKKGRDWDQETSVSEEQPSRQSSSSEEKAKDKKKKSPKKKKRESLNKHKKATEEKKLQKTAEIVSRQSLAAQFFGTVADTEKQGDAKVVNTPIITVHDHDSEVSVTNKQMTERQNSSFLEDLKESGPPSSPESSMAAASNTSSTCANCENLKRQIEFLKRNQMPGTHLQ